jgi:microcystin-dependent protein
MSDQSIGEIRMFAGSYAPQDWALCNGQTLPISGYQTLYALLGVAYGGDGKTTFGLPDLRSRLPISLGPAASGTTYTLAQKDGAETVPLQVAQIPGHSHAPMAASVKATSSSPVGNLMAQTVNSNGGTNEDIMYVGATSPVVKTFTLNSSAVATTGQNQSHANIMPCSPVNFIIALQGIYPQFQ